MNKIRRPEALIFDLDGTLFKTESLLIPAYHKTFEQLRKEGWFRDETPPEELFLGGLGLLLDEIWDRVIPHTSNEVREKANQFLLYYQLEGLKHGEGELYPEVEQTLRQLREHEIRLFVASNGLEEYVDGVIKYKGLAELFEGLYSAGGYQTASKVDLVRIILENHNLNTGKEEDYNGSVWMVGDRSSDVEAGVKNQLPVVACQYAGFGEASELEGAQMQISTFSELATLIRSLK